MSRRELNEATSEREWKEKALELLNLYEAQISQQKETIRKYQHHFAQSMTSANLDKFQKEERSL